jgi:hypothetical protein
MDTIDLIKQLPSKKPRCFDMQQYATDLVSTHIHWRKVSSSVSTARTDKGRTQARRWCMKRVPWVFTKDALKREFGENKEETTEEFNRQFEEWRGDSDGTVGVD